MWETNRPTAKDEDYRISCGTRCGTYRLCAHLVILDSVIGFPKADVASLERSAYRRASGSQTADVCYLLEAFLKTCCNGIIVSNSGFCFDALLWA